MKTSFKNFPPCLLAEMAKVARSVTEHKPGEYRVVGQAFRPIRMSNSYIHLLKFSHLVTLLTRPQSPSYSRDTAQEEIGAEKGTHYPLLFHFARCRVPREDGWGRVRFTRLRVALLPLNLPCITRKKTARKKKKNDFALARQTKWKRDYS